MHSQAQSPLLQLPAELQLAIFEFAVREPEPLLLNCACDSSYYGDYERYEEDQDLWEEGKLGPPKQPALTQTCKLIRDITLPMFYKLNIFRAHYCYAADQAGAIEWLDCIGAKNRLVMRDICFIDMNPHFDVSCPKDLKKLRRSKLVKELNGKLETLEDERCCFHRVTFRPVVEDQFDGMEELFAV